VERIIHQSSAGHSPSAVYRALGRPSAVARLVAFLVILPVAACDAASPLEPENAPPHAGPDAATDHEGTASRPAALDHDVATLGEAEPADDEVTIRACTLPFIGNEPLLVIDGTPVGDAPDLDMSRILEIEVLKGQRAVARYGEAARYGAILIRTRS
jgi:hypothetical protein